MHSRRPKFEYNNGIGPITKFVFKLIYNGNIFHTFRKEIPSLNYSKIETIKTLRINFCKAIMQPD